MSDLEDRRQAGKKARPFPFKKARALVFALVVALVAVGLAFRTGTGTPSSFGLDAIAALCPLGALETMLGAREVMLHPLLLLAAMLAAIVVLGKAFCAWMCPAPWLQRLVKPGKRKADGASTVSDSAAEADESAAANLAAEPGAHSCVGRHGRVRLSRVLPRVPYRAHVRHVHRALAPVPIQRDIVGPRHLPRYLGA